jgi:hypothetical protein
MSDPDPLKAMFEAGEAPETDPGFRMDVMTRVSYRRLWLETMQRIGLFLLLGIAGLLAAPAITEALALPIQIYLILGGAGALAYAGHYLITHKFKFKWPLLRLI